MLLLGEVIEVEESGVERIFVAEADRLLETIEVNVEAMAISLP